MAQAEVTMVPQTWTALTSEADVKAMNKMLDLLEDDDSSDEYLDEDDYDDRESEDGRPDEFDYDRFYDIKDEIEEDSDPADMKD